MPFHPRQPQKLSYFLSEKKSILIVSLIGPLVMQNAAIFEDCIKEIEASTALWVIINFRDVPDPQDNSLFPPLARLMKMVRDRKPTQLRLASLHPDFKQKLQEAGLLEPQEVTNNLSDALNAIHGDARNAA